MTHITGAPRKCDNPRCRYCPKLCTDGHIVPTVTAKKYQTRHNVSCNSNNLVYCISCTRCGKQYVGQTKNSLKQRFQGHFYQIAQDVENTEVSRHFNRNGQQGIKDVGIHKTDASQVEPKTKKCKTKTKPKRPVTETHSTTSDDTINKKVKLARKKRVNKSRGVNKDNKLVSQPSHTSSTTLM